MKQLLGVVMCGGQSRRMGTDKGLIKNGYSTWAQLAYYKLTDLQLPVVISVNPAQQQQYLQVFNPEQLVTDMLTVPGPLNGLLTIHAQYPDKDILALACDMTDMKAATLQQLTAAWQNNPGFDFYAFSHEDFFEPLCAIYTSAALAAVTQRVAAGTLTISLQSIINAGTFLSLPVTNAESFNNVNSREGWY